MVNKKLIYKREFPLFGKPLKIDTVSFEDATVEETVEYFKERIIEYKASLVTARSEKLDEAEQKIIQLSKDAIGLRETITEKETIIRYIEGRLEVDRDY